MYERWLSVPKIKIQRKINLHNAQHQIKCTSHNMFLIGDLKGAVLKFPVIFIVVINLQDTNDNV